MPCTLGLMWRKLQGKLSKNRVDQSHSWGLGVNMFGKQPCKSSLRGLGDPAFGHKARHQARGSDVERRIRRAASLGGERYRRHLAVRKPPREVRHLSRGTVLDGNLAQAVAHAPVD